MSSAVVERPDTSLHHLDLSMNDFYFDGYPIAPTPWQDDLCLEPMTPVSGFSKLCNACIKIFRDDISSWDPHDENSRRNRRHIRSSEVLEISARRGCRLCALLLTDIQKRASRLHVAMTRVNGLCFYKSIGIMGVSWSKITFWGMELPSWRFTLFMYPAEGQSVLTGSSVL